MIYVFNSGINVSTFKIDIFYLYLNLKQSRMFCFYPNTNFKGCFDIFLQEKILDLRNLSLRFMIFMVFIILTI